MTKKLGKLKPVMKAPTDRDEALRVVQQRVDAYLDEMQRRKEAKQRRVSQGRHVYSDPPPRLVNAEMTLAAWNPKVRWTETTGSDGKPTTVPLPVHVAGSMIGKMGKTLCGVKILVGWCIDLIASSPFMFGERDDACAKCAAILSKILAKAEPKPDLIRVCHYCGKPAMWKYYYMQPEKQRGQFMLRCADHWCAWCVPIDQEGSNARV